MGLFLGTVDNQIVLTRVSVVEEGLYGPSLLKQLLNDKGFSQWELDAVSEVDSELGDFVGVELL